MNHKADEAYMAKMCHEGWAAASLVEGVWTFEPCRPDQYTFRVCYLRGKSKADVEELKRTLAVLLLAIKVSAWFGGLCGFVAVYAVMCVCLCTSYTRLLHRIKMEKRCV